MLPNEQPKEKSVENNNDFNEQKSQKGVEDPKIEIISDSLFLQPSNDNSVVVESSSIDTADTEILDQSLAIEEKIGVLLSKVEELKDELSQRREYDKFRDEAILRMSKQIEAHELGLMRKIKESLLRDIICFYDTIDSFQEKFYKNDDRVKLNKDIQFLKEEVEEILFRNDVTIIEAPENNLYNREIQTVIKKEITNIETENNEIIKFFRQGFKIGDKILRKQEIIIKEFKNILLN